MPRPPTYVTIVVNDNVSENDATDPPKSDRESQCERILPAPFQGVQREGAAHAEPV
jgi:hypothetical protein